MNSGAKLVKIYDICKFFSQILAYIEKKSYLCSRIDDDNDNENDNYIMLKIILAITGKPGLYKLVSRGNNMLIVESLVDGKRIPTYSRDKIVALSDISMFTTGDDVSLSEVLTKVGEKEGLKPIAGDIKKMDNPALKAWFSAVLPNWDEDRVYPSDIRKLMLWYNVLVNAGITDFTVKDDDDNADVDVNENK